MSIPRRHSSQLKMGAGERTFFVTSSLWDKRSLLQSSRSAALFIDTLYAYRAQNKFRLHDFVVMPDHFHILITVGAEITIERAVQFVKGFAFRAGKELGLPAPIWQKGFSEIRVLDGETFENQSRHIRNHPTAAGLSRTAEEYPYSSAHDAWETDPPPTRLIFLAELCGAPEGAP